MPEFVQLTRVIRRLGRSGRRGGLLGLALGAVLGVSGTLIAWLTGPWNGEMVWYPALCVLGIAMDGLALFAGFLGMRQVLFPPDVEALPSKDAFVASVSEVSLPVRVCMQCRKIVSDYESREECPRCLSRRDCFNVTSPRDIRALIAAIPD